jgi:hypothetical protein
MSEPDNEHPSAAVTAGPVSPELVLVDPDLAEIARDQLKLREVPASRREVDGSTLVVSAPLDLEDFRARASRAAAVEAAARQTRRRKQRRIVVLVAAGMLAAAAAAVAVVSGMRPATQDGERASADAEPPVEASPASPPPSEVPANSRGRERTAFAPRTFVWPPVSGAAFYRVEFFRGRRKVFEASPTKPRLELPLSWSHGGRRFRLTRGKYRWEVRPAFGARSRPRYGPPVTRSTWTAQ